MTSQAPRVAGKYQIKSVLGKGGHGTVYRATHVDLGDDVALKVLNPEVADDDEAQKRFLREVKLATSFVHEYAVQVREFGRDADTGSLYFTMDLVDGAPLQDELKAGALEPERAVRLMVQALRVLEKEKPKTFQLSSLRGKQPVALIFGSYT